MRIIPPVLPALLLAAGTLSADTIYTVDDMVVIGKVKEETEKSVVVATEKGVFSVPRYRVLAIDYDFDSRKARLREDDFAGRYGLALWALERGMKKEALVELRAVAGRPGVPPEAFLKTALLLKEQGDLKGAFQALSEYLKLRPDDRKARELFDEVKKAVAPAARPAAAGASSSKNGAGNDASPAKVEEGLEARGRWTLEGWGNKAAVDVVSGKDGNKSLAILAPAGGKQDKVAVGLAGRTDLSGKTRLVFNAFVDGKAPVDIALALITDQYYESRMVRLKPGWNTGVSVDLSAKEFKCKATNWRFEAGVKRLDRVRRLIFLIYNFGAEANVYLDSVRAE